MESQDAADHVASVLETVSRLFVVVNDFAHGSSDADLNKSVRNLKSHKLALEHFLNISGNTHVVEDIESIMKAQTAVEDYALELENKLPTRSASSERDEMIRVTEQLNLTNSSPELLKEEVIRLNSELDQFLEALVDHRRPTAGLRRSNSHRASASRTQPIPQSLNDHQNSNNTSTTDVDPEDPLQGIHSLWKLSASAADTMARFAQSVNEYIRGVVRDEPSSTMPSATSQLVSSNLDEYQKREHEVACSTSSDTKDETMKSLLRMLSEERAKLADCTRDLKLGAA